MAERASNKRESLQDTDELSGTDLRGRSVRDALAKIIGGKRGAGEVVALPDLISIRERFFDMVMVLEIVAKRSKMIPGFIDGNIQTRIPTDKLYAVFFQRLHEIANFFGPGVVRRPEERYPSGIPESEGEAHELVAEKIIRGLGPFRQPLRLIVQCRLKERGAAGGKIEKGLPSRLRSDRLQDRQNNDHRP